MSGKTRALARSRVHMIVIKTSVTVGGETRGLVSVQSFHWQPPLRPLSPKPSHCSLGFLTNIISVQKVPRRPTKVVQPTQTSITLITATFTHGNVLTFQGWRLQFWTGAHDAQPSLPTQLILSNYKVSILWPIILTGHIGLKYRKIILRDITWE